MPSTAEDRWKLSRLDVALEPDWQAISGTSAMPVTRRRGDCDGLLVSSPVAIVNACDSSPDDDVLHQCKYQLMKFNGRLTRLPKAADDAANWLA